MHVGNGVTGVLARMDQTAFKPDTRYTLSLRSNDGRVRPANLYVYRTYGDFFVARATGTDGLLRKIRYADVERIVTEYPVSPADRYLLPPAMLDEQAWRDRDVMLHYATSARRGK